MRKLELLQPVIRRAARERVSALDLSYKNLKSLPAEIGQLTDLTKLDLSGNQLTMLPAEIGQLINLTELDLSFNRFTTLPAEIGQLTNLTKLDLGSNCLISLPSEIRQLTKLKKLSLWGNPLQIPPEVLGGNRYKLGKPVDILNYYFNLQTDQKKPLNEAKMLLVGQGSVGKTSLVKRLLEDAFDPHQPKTDGISIQPWNLPINDRTIQLNVWDFGGQEIMHATHQFFLTKRSLYLLVLDTRLSEEENRLEYWLKIIQSFGCNSPIIIVGNKIDQHPLDIDKRGLKTKYPNIEAIVETSCQTSTGIETLKTAISQEIAQLEHIHDLLPLSWFEVKTRLERLSEDFIPYTTYESLCQDQSVTDEQSQRTLIRFLHDLGVVLNFQDDPRLEDTNVLNPEWVTNSVYKVLNDNLLMTRYYGILERNELSRILDPQRYPKHKHLFIVDMMRKFELCFDLESYKDEQFLIPDLLTKEEPYTGEWDNALSFQYHYNVLPGSIISRFIVRMNSKIHQHTYWRNGVVLKDRNNRALIKADREDKIIFIRIHGPEVTRRTFLSAIRCQFDEIHKTLPGLTAIEKVPLPDHPEILLDYQDLLSAEEMSEESYLIPKLKQKISLRQLLNGIESETQRQVRRDESEESAKTRRRSSPAKPAPVRNQVFVSYSHQDREWLERLQKHLKPLVRKDAIAIWDDTKIQPGAEWRKEIEKALLAAKVAVLLVSPDFLASDFIHENELPPLLDAAEKEGLTIIWIPVKASSYKHTEIEKYQSAHNPQQALIGLSEAKQDDALVKICEKIKEAVDSCVS